MTNYVTAYLTPMTGTDTQRIIIVRHLPENNFKPQILTEYGWEDREEAFEFAPTDGFPITVSNNQPQKTLGQLNLDYRKALYDQAEAMIRVNAARDAIEAHSEMQFPSAKMPEPIFSGFYTDKKPTLLKRLTNLLFKGGANNDRPDHPQDAD